VRGVTGNLKTPKPSHIFKHSLTVVEKIQVSAIECEQSFSRMNLYMPRPLPSLQTDKVSTLLAIKLAGLLFLNSVVMNM
jgi:hypothetical protein